MYNLSAIFLKCCVPWLRQEPLGHDRQEIHFCRVREVRCAEQRGNMDPTPLHQGTNAVAQVPRQRSVTTRSHVPVSFRAQREKKFFDPKKLRPGQTGSFLKIPNLSPSLVLETQKKILRSSTELMTRRPFWMLDDTTVGEVGNPHRVVECVFPLTIPPCRSCFGRMSTVGTQFFLYWSLISTLPCRHVSSKFALK